MHRTSKVRQLHIIRQVVVIHSIGKEKWICKRTKLLKATIPLTRQLHALSKVRQMHATRQVAVVHSIEEIHSIDEEKWICERTKLLKAT